MGDFIFKSLCRHLSKRHALTLVTERPSSAENTQLAWLKQISKMCCEQLLEECQKSSQPESAMPLQAKQEEDEAFAARCMLQFQQQQHQCSDAIAQAEQVIQRMESVKHRLKTVTDEVQEIYAQLAGVCTEVVDHKNATASHVDDVLGALRGGRDELSGAQLAL